MSGQGKSLQDIYDEGSKKLDESEQCQRNTLHEGSAHGVEEVEQVESGMTTKMDHSLVDLEAEIRAYLDKAVEGINAAVNSETEENRKFLERLQETLKLSCQTLSDDVKVLRGSMLQKFNASSEQCMSLQHRELEKGLARLKADGSGAAAHLKELTLGGNAGFNSRGSSLVLQALDKNFKVPGEFFIEFHRHAHSIEKRINDCLQLLSSRSKEIISDLNSGGTQVQTSLDQVVKNLATEMDTVYQNADSRLKMHCEDALSAALLHQEELSNNLKTELFESHQSNSGISEKSQALKTDTEHLLEQVKQLLVDVDNGVRANCETATEDFGKSLIERLESAKQHGELVAEERGQLMERIAGDLQEIENNFNLRLTQLAEKCQSRLSSVCVEAELAITSSHDTCAAEFKSVSELQQKSIEDKTLQLLRDIETLSQKATQNIRSAAGDTGSQTAPLPTATLNQLPSGAIAAAQPLPTQPTPFLPTQPQPTQAPPTQAQPPQPQTTPEQAAPSAPGAGSADSGTSNPSVPSAPSNPFGDFGDLKL